MQGAGLNFHTYSIRGLSGTLVACTGVRVAEPFVVTLRYVICRYCRGSVRQGGAWEVHGLRGCCC